MIHQDTEPELEKVPDLEGYHHKEGVRDVKLGEDLTEDQRHMLKDLINRYPYVFTDIPKETDVIQHRVKLTDDTRIRCGLYPLLKIEVVRPSTSPYASPIIMVKTKAGSNRVCVDFRKLSKITKVRTNIME